MGSATLNVTKDTYVSSFSSGTNYGTDTEMKFVMASSIGNGRLPLMEFDISSLSGLTITSATLNVYCNEIQSATAHDIYIRRATATFTENTVTYGTRPAHTTTNQTIVSTTYATGWHSFDVADMLQDAIGLSLSEIDIYLMASTSSNYMNFRTKEYSTSYDAYLSITYITYDFYVRATGGSDSNDGESWANAWSTINKAATTVLDGTTVHIGFGTYNSEPVSNKIAPDNLGSAGIKYLPETAITGGGTGSVIIEVN